MAILKKSSFFKVTFKKKTMKKTGTFTENQKLKKKKKVYKKKKAGTNSDSSEELIQLLPLNIFQFHLDITVSMEQH